jgi:hypothetical protein
LRLCMIKENSRNSIAKKSNKSGYKGVMWRKNRLKWISKINIDGKRFYLGTFENKTDAALAYNRAAEKYFGEFAYLNKI